jgi:uncharacterized protein YcbK (DUF882 family)
LTIPARLLVAFSALVAVRDVPAYRPAASARAAVVASDTPLVANVRPPRVTPWAASLAPLDVANVTTRARTNVRLYEGDGSIDEDARAAFERIAAGGDEVRPLASRLEQLVMKAAYHFARARILIVSGFRPNAGRHGTGDALDFKLEGVPAARLAGYLRQLPRVGVGIYTHPRTQFVHLDVRDVSYHWLDASPPGVKWRERMLADPAAKKRDAAWKPEMDQP